jgi:hypothetical protein
MHSADHSPDLSEKEYIEGASEAVERLIFSIVSHVP